MEQQNRGADGSDKGGHIDELFATAATVGVVGAGALLPGMVLGVVTMMLPK
jgi:hypothetical protein